MPSSPKHVERRKDDFYETPYWVIRALLDEIKKTDEIGAGTKIVEPCAGSGAISRELKKYIPECDLKQYEIRYQEKEKLKKFGNVRIYDFLKTRTIPETDVKYVITNPPFSL